MGVLTAVALWLLIGTIAILVLILEIILLFIILWLVAATREAWENKRYIVSVVSCIAIALIVIFGLFVPVYVVGAVFPALVAAALLALA